MALRSELLCLVGLSNVGSSGPKIVGMLHSVFDLESILCMAGFLVLS